MQTHKIEKQIIALYKKSKNKKDITGARNAKQTVEEILQTFRLLDIFINDNHAQIVKSIYFTRWNIVEIGVRAMAMKVFMPERTLYKYRQKYCAIILEILKEKELYKQ